MNSKLKKILIPAAVILVAVIALIVILVPSASDNPSTGSTSGSPNTPEKDLVSEIDLSAYIVIEGAIGPNGEGILKYTFDEDALSKTMMDSLNADYFSDKSKEAFMAAQLDRLTEIGNVLKCITTQTVGSTTGLSNGDEVTVTASFENTQNYSFSFTFKNGEKRHKVSGLTEGKEIAPLEYARVSFDVFGIDAATSLRGFAELEILLDETLEPLFDYRLSKRSPLFNGDFITLTVSYDEEALARKGYTVTGPLEQTLTVSGLPEFVNDPKMLPDDLLPSLIAQAMQESAASEAGREAEGHSVREHSSVKGAFLLTAKDRLGPKLDWNHDYYHNNAIIVITHYTYESAGTEEDAWLIWVFPNYYRDTTGSYHFIDSMRYHVRGENAWSDVLAWFSDYFSDMNITELNLP